MHVEDFVAKRITELCEKQHITMYRLAQLSGLKQSTISNITKRSTLPNLVTLEKICGGFGITLSQFFQENECLSLTEEQKDILGIWIALNDDEKKLVKSVLKGITDAKR